MRQDGMTPVERFARSQNGPLRRWLQRSFGVKLTREDIADVIGEAYADAVADAGGLLDEELRPWMYRVARNRAIGRIRRLEGEGAVKRSTVSLSLYSAQGDDGVSPSAPAAAMVTDDEAAHDELASAELSRADAQRVHSALERLPEAEREVLRMCAIDGISIRGAVELTGMSKKQVENTRTRAIARFRTLIGAPMSTECGRARGLIQPGHLVDAPLARWRDAHLAGCLGCQVQGDAAYGKRLQGIAPLLPVTVPALGPLEALWAKLAAVLPSAGRVPAEAAGAGISSGGAAGLLGTGTAVKLAAVAVLGAGAATPVIRQVRSPEPQLAAVSAPAAPRPDTGAAAPRPRQAPRATSAPRSRPATTTRRPARARSRTTTTAIATATATPAARARTRTIAASPPPAGAPSAPAAARSTQAPAVPAPAANTEAFGQEFSP